MKDKICLPYRTLNLTLSVCIGMGYHVKIEEEENPCLVIFYSTIKIVGNDSLGHTSCLTPTQTAVKRLV